jgi:hypothetical protein
MHLLQLGDRRPVHLQQETVLAGDPEALDLVCLLTIAKENTAQADLKENSFRAT